MTVLPALDAKLALLRDVDGIGAREVDADELARDAVATVGQRMRRERAWDVNEMEVV